jgi:Strictosidine synthase-like, N-terminal
MTDRQTKGKSDSAFHAVGHLIQRAVCLGAIVFIYTNASAANLFMSDGYSGIDHNLGHIYKFTTRGVASTFRSGLDGPEGLAFDVAGNLYVTSFFGHIYKFTPGGARTTFASGQMIQWAWPLTAQATYMWRMKAAAASINSD